MLPKAWCRSGDDFGGDGFTFWDRCMVDVRGFSTFVVDSVCWDSEGRFGGVVFCGARGVRGSWQHQLRVREKGPADHVRAGYRNIEGLSFY